MRSLDLPDTPFWALFRLKWRETWPRPRIRKVALAFLCILAVQGVVTYLTVRWAPRSPYPMWTTAVLYSLGLISSSWAAILASAKPNALPATHLLMSVAGGFVVVAMQFIMPAFAALSIAPDRRSGRVAQYRMAGLRGADILLASGLAALLPFAALVVTFVLAASLAVVTGVISSGGTLRSLWPGTPVWVWAVIHVGTFMAKAGILVSVSALCRRPFTTLTVCYTSSWLLLPLIPWITLLRLSMPRLGGGMDGSVATLALSFPVLAVLVSVAFSRLEREDA